MGVEVLIADLLKFNERADGSVDSRSIFCLSP